MGIRLLGGVAFTGAGPDVTWRRLRVNLERDRITARINGGERVAILRSGDGRDDDGHHRLARRGGDDSLRLTRAGARSLNRSAAGSPFDAGDVVAHATDGCG